MMPRNCSRVIDAVSCATRSEMKTTPAKSQRMAITRARFRRGIPDAWLSRASADQASAWKMPGRYLGSFPTTSPLRRSRSQTTWAGTISKATAVASHRSIVREKMSLRYVRSGRVHPAARAGAPHHHLLARVQDRVGEVELPVALRRVEVAGDDDVALPGAEGVEGRGRVGNQLVGRRHSHAGRDRVPEVDAEARQLAALLHDERGEDPGDGADGGRRVRGRRRCGKREQDGEREGADHPFTDPQLANSTFPVSRS